MCLAGHALALADLEVQMVARAGAGAADAAELLAGLDLVAGLDWLGSTMCM